MIIQNSNISMGASRSYRSKSSNFSALSMWDNKTGNFSRNILSGNSSAASETGIPEYLKKARAALTNAENQSTDGTDENDPKTKETAADRARSMNNLFLRMNPTNKKRNVDLNLKEQIEQIRRIQHSTINYLMQMLFGGKYNSSKMMDTTDDGTTQNSYPQSEDMNLSSSSFDNIPSFGGQFYTYSSYYEKEVTSFASTGTVKTADGRSIDFNINVNMSRSFYETYADQIDFGAARICKDPLVINLNSNIATVSDQTFLFDIDADGELDEISRLNKNSGYLALDKNGDGIINDGSELFGTLSGNGFADLAAYDEDGNGWIDEADSVFSMLKVWVMDENGESNLLDLKEAGVGAMYLGSESTEFSLNDAQNNTDAVIRRTGVFLYENGDVGTMQQLDLAT